MSDSQVPCKFSFYRSEMGHERGCEKRVLKINSPNLQVVSDRNKPNTQITIYKDNIETR